MDIVSSGYDINNFVDMLGEWMAQIWRLICQWRKIIHSIQESKVYKKGEYEAMPFSFMFDFLFGYLKMRNFLIL